MTPNLAKSPELSVTVQRRMPRLVLDPRLCLSAAGPLLVEKLQGEAELWLPRELWRILDNSHYFSLRPEALFDDSAPSAGTAEYEFTLRQGLVGCGAADSAAGACTDEVSAPSELACTLEAWDAIRMSNDLLGLRLFWLGDGLPESLIPPGGSEELHPRFEMLAEQLDGLLAPSSPLSCAQRDVLALSLALGGVPILGLLEAGSAPPALCAFAKAGLTVREVAKEDACAALEREQYRALLVRSQCAPLLWSALELVIFHVHAPATQRQRLGSRAAAFADAEPRRVRGFAEATLYWYRL
jgi:hypothetical protein